MANIQFANYAQTTLVANMTAATTSMVVASSTTFPAIGAGPLYFWATIVDQASFAGNISPPAQREIVKVTAISGVTWTILRGQDSTSAQIWSANAVIEARLNAAACNDLIAAGGGAPTTSQYVTLVTDAGLTNERTLAVEASVLTLTDGGANNPVTVAVAASGITNAKLANMAASSIKGNNTGGVAVALDLTVAQTKTLLAIAASDVSGLATIATTGSATNLSAGTVPAARMPALTGPITSTVGTVATAVTANAITNAMLAQMPTLTIKGNNTAGTANALDLTPSQVSTMLNLLTTAGVPYIINGGCEVAQGVIGTLSTSPAYGSCALFKCGVIAGTVSAGTIIQATAAPCGRTGYALQVSGASMTTTPTLAADHFIEAKDAVRLKNATVAFSVIVYHDVGSTQTYTMSIDKATAPDNFAGVTNITSNTAGVNNATATTITLSGFSIGDCSNGIRIRVSVAPGTVTTKNFYWTEWVLSEAYSAQSAFFTQYSFIDELRREQRYYYKTFPYATAPAQNAGLAGAWTWPATKAAALAGFSNAFSFPVVTRVSPPTTVTLYNPSVANAQVRDVTGAVDCTAAATSQPGDANMGVSFTGNAATAIGNQLAIHATADSRF
jgi:hypothetical protein